MIKAAYFDIDGTLVTHNQQITPKTRQALDALHDKGIKLFVATGRSDKELQEFRKLYNFDGYIILNGSKATYKDFLYEAYLDTEEVRQVLEFLKLHDIGTIIVDGKDSYINMAHEGMQKAFLESIQKNDYPIYDMNNINERKVYQLMTHIDEDKEDIEKQFFQIMKSARGTRWNETSTDVIPKESGKHIGIQALNTYLGIKQDEWIAFGDNDNDLQMIQNAGIGIAMGNATNELKEAADYITDTNEEDGIYTALVHYGLL